MTGTECPELNPHSEINVLDLKRPEVSDHPPAPRTDFDIIQKWIGEIIARFHPS